MKRSWYSIMIVGSVLGLLTLFLGLQYKWLSAVSDAERERMQKRVETDARRFAEDFDREMQAAYYNFQTGARVWKNADWEEFNARYDFWKERTAYPELIRDIYFFAKEDGRKPLKYDSSRRSFEPVEIDRDLEDLHTRFVDEANTQTVYDDQFAMVLPIYDDERRIEQIAVRRMDHEGPSRIHMPEKFGWLVIRLDAPTVKERVLPDLATKYFAENDYKVAVVNRSDQTEYSTQDMTGEDATAKMFSMSPDNLFFFGNRDALPKVMGERTGGIVIDQKIESHTFARTESGNGEKTGSFDIQLRQPGEKGKLRTAMIATSGANAPPWTLRVQHVAGSIETYVRNERIKSFALGLGVYLLLVAGIMAIMLSALRSRRFAQRQIDFVSSVSHEFRTPLAVIYSAGENLADGVAKEGSQVARYGELIKGEGKKLSGMVEQILEFAGANSGKQKYSFTPVNITDIVNDALSECGPLIESGGFEVDTDLPRDLPVISADKGALSSAIQNLIANAVKYSNGSSWIKVSAANGGGRIRIAVEDKGIGIRAGELTQIFEPFYRSKQVVDAQISGNGLGLNLVKKIVEAHGGNVSVESTVGAGSKFTIELPQQGLT